MIVDMSVTPHGKPIKMWIDKDDVEESAMQQLYNVASLPFIFKHVAVMPDVHAGIGATIGSVVATKGAVVPSIVGVDLGCGMVAERLNVKADTITPAQREDIYAEIMAAIPTGRSNHGGDGDVGSWREDKIPDDVRGAWDDLSCGYGKITGRHPGLHHKNAKRQLGTLGTGNHFIELCADEESNIWIVIHSGSRGPGNKIGSYFIKKAKEECAMWMIDLPDPNLAHLPEHAELFDDYVCAAEWAQCYAHVNRDDMAGRAFIAVDTVLGRSDTGVTGWAECHHNFVAKEHHFGQNVWVSRKGAVRARKNDDVIIPGSMGTATYIATGKGEAQSFMSCSHGAGRNMSRTKAAKTFTVEQHEEWTKDIVCNKSTDVLDETPGAYKDIDDVIALQSDLITVTHKLKQLVNIKGISEPRRKKKPRSDSDIAKSV